jgi:hypothetical protein
MGRPKDFPNIYDDLLTKYKSKSTADKEYKECLAMARVSQVGAWEKVLLLLVEVLFFAVNRSRD